VQKWKTVRRRAYICQQAAVQAKKQEEGVPPKGTSPLNQFIKRKKRKINLTDLLKIQRW